MIDIIFDFNNNIGTFKDNEMTFVRHIEIVQTTPYWQVASFAFSTSDGRRITASWKVWKETKQIVELDEFDQEWYELAKWSYTENSNSEVLGGRRGYSVIVVGSKYGDWMSI